jgi:hypothetical protein
LDGLVAGLNLLLQLLDLLLLRGNRILLFGKRVFQLLDFARACRTRSSAGFGLGRGGVCLREYEGWHCQQQR